MSVSLGIFNNGFDVLRKNSIDFSFHVTFIRLLKYLKLMIFSNKSISQPNTFQFLYFLFNRWYTIDVYDF